MRRGGAEDPVLVVVDEGAMKLEDFIDEAGGVHEGVAVASAGVECEDELGVFQVNEVQAADGLAVGAVGGGEAEVVRLVHEDLVLEVGGLGEGGEGGEVAALVVLVGLEDHFAKDIEFVFRRHACVCWLRPETRSGLLL